MRIARYLLLNFLLIHISACFFNHNPVNQATPPQNIESIDNCPNFNEEKRIDSLDLTIESSGKRYFRWKIGQNYRNGIFSYDKLTIVTYTDKTANRVKEFLINQRKLAKDRISSNNSLIYITHFDAQMFIIIAQATKEIGEDILDVILTHCYQCERACGL